MDYIGWGDPYHALWFVGIEEHEGWANESEILGKLGPSSRSIREEHGVLYRYGPEAGYRADETSKIGDWESRIAAPLSANESEPTTYKQTRLWLPGSATFHCNIWSLGRPSERAWPQVYSGLFGMTQDEWKRTRHEVCTARFNRVQGFRQRADVQATVCFGVTHRSAFEAFLGLQADSGKESDDRRLRVWEDAKVILAYHWSGRGEWRLNQKDIAVIVNKLRSWGVALP